MTRCLIAASGPLKKAQLFSPPAAGETPNPCHPTPSRIAVPRRRGVGQARTRACYNRTIERTCENFCQIAGETSALPGADMSVCVHDRDQGVISRVIGLRERERERESFMVASFFSLQKSVSYDNYYVNPL